MRVLHVVSCLSLADGVARVVQKIVTGLPPDIFECWVCCLAAEGELAGPIREAGGRVFSVGAKSSMSPLWMPANLRAALRIARCVRTRGIDVVHSHEFFAGALGRLGARLGGCRHNVWSLHNADRWKRVHHLAADRLLTRTTSAVVCNSEAVRQFAIRSAGLPSGKLTTIYHGIDPAEHEPERSRSAVRRELGIPEGALVVGSVGRLVEQKGHETTIWAFARVRRTFPHARLVIVGDEGDPRDGSTGPVVRGLIAKLGLVERVILAGRRSDVPDLMHAFDVFALASRWEGFGLVLIEAMLAGLPIVATTADAIPEVAPHGEAALLVPVDAPEQMADALCQLLSDAQTRQAMGESGQERVRTVLSLEAMVRQYEQLYLGLLDRASPGPATRSTHAAMDDSVTRRQGVVKP